MKKNPKLRLARHTVRELSANTLTEVNGGYRVLLVPTIDMPTGACVPPPSDDPDHPVLLW